MPVKTLPVTIGHATPHLFWLWAQARLQTKKTLNYKLSIMKLFAQDDKANEAVVDEAIEKLLSTAKEEEPAVTKLLMGAAEMHDGYLIGLDFK